MDIPFWKQGEKTWYLRIQWSREMRFFLARFKSDKAIIKGAKAYFGIID